MCVLSACADVLWCADVAGSVRYAIMWGSMASRCSLFGCVSLGVLLRTLRCVECDLRPVVVDFVDELAQDLVLVGELS